MEKNRKIKKMISVLMAITISLSMLGGVMTDTMHVEASSEINNPRIEADGTVTWDKVQFGSYYQNLVEIKEEPIKWIVYDIDNVGNAILVSKEALDCKAYNSKGVIKTLDTGDEYTDYSCTWETCTLRDWLNGTGDYLNDPTAFINAAFGTEERNAIIESNVDVDDDYYDSEDVNSVSDKIYIPSNADGMGAANVTDYAFFNGAYRQQGKGFYWTRTPGFDPATFDSDYGNAVAIDYSPPYDTQGNPGIPVWVADFVAVRPVLKVNIASEYVEDAGKDTINGNTYDCVYFGNYKQHATFVKKPIEWRVLSVNGNDAFVIAENALDCKPYYEGNACSWEKCLMRDWLNGTGEYKENPEAFINAAFSDTEKNTIIESTVVNNDNQSYYVTGGNDTKDKVYLLSIEEASNPAYGFDINLRDESETRRAVATEYAIVNGAPQVSGYPYSKGSWWWLRSSTWWYYICEKEVHNEEGTYQDSVSLYNFSGSCDAVRPVMHIDLSSQYVTYAGTVTVKSSITLDDIKAAENAAKVDELIDAIGTVTIESKDKIESARKAYDALTDIGKEHVTKLKVLVAAEEELAEIEKSSDKDSTEKPTEKKTEAPSETPSKSDSVKAPAKTAISVAKNVKGKKLSVKWKKVTGAKGYQLQYSANKKFKKAKTKTTKKTTITIKKLKKKKIYYVRVRAYKIDASGKKVPGKWSKVKKVKIKK